MAFWGAPVADAEHARHAIMTALEMQSELRKLDAPFAGAAGRRCISALASIPGR